MAFYTTTIAGEATGWLPGPELIAWMRDRMVENGWVHVGDFDALPISANFTGPLTNVQMISAVTASSIKKSGGVSWSSQLTGLYAKIKSGTGAGQKRVITGGSGDSMSIKPDWSVTPDGTSIIDIVATSTVMRSPAHLNSLGCDFYLILRHFWGVNNQGVGWFLSESFDAQTMSVSRYAPNAPGSLTLNADYTCADSWTLGDYNRYGMRTYQSLGVSSTYEFHVDIDTVILARSGMVQYAGVYDSALPRSIDPVPLCIGDLTSSPATGGSVITTREPLQTVVGSTNWQCSIPGADSSTNRYYAYSVPSFAPGAAPLVLSTVPDLYRGNLATPVFFKSSRSATSVRGSFRNILTSFSGGALGDVLNVTDDDGVVTTWVMRSVAGTSTAALFLRAA